MTAKRSWNSKGISKSKEAAEHLVYISDKLIIPTFRSQAVGMKPSRGYRTDEQKQKLREILQTPTGFIHLVNEYEELYVHCIIFRRELNYLKLIKKQAKQRAVQEYCAKNKLKGYKSHFIWINLDFLL